MRKPLKYEEPTEKEKALEFFHSLPQSEQVRLARYFHDLIERDVSELYEWKRALAMVAGPK